MNFIERYKNFIPEGAKPEDIVSLTCAAAITQVTEAWTNEEPVVAAGLVQAGPPLLNAERKPTIMRIEAWMVHEGINDNRQFFLAEDLKNIAPTLFREPNFGVMDWNHSAARHFTDDPRVIGVWFKAQYMFDEKAQKYGILASGSMFSWLFPEQADSLLADQSRLGHMRFSMMALPETLELAEDENGPFAIIHNPAFMAVSALDVPPADRFGLGAGSESVSATEETLRQRLLTAAMEHPWLKATPKHADLPTVVVANEGAAMDETKLVELAQANTKLENELVAAKQALETATTEHTTAIEAVRAELVLAQTKITETEVARDAAIADRDTATARIVELEAQVTELSTFKASIDAKSAEEAKAELLASRKAKLPEGYLAEFEKKPEERRAVLEEKWIAMSDEQFAVYLEDELGYKIEPKLSYLDRSRNEGILPTGAGAEPEQFNIGARVRKLMNS